MNTALFLFLVAVDVTGATLYALIDPQGHYIFPDADEEENQAKRRSDFVNLIRFLGRVIGYSLLLLPWMMGFANIFEALKKARHYHKLRNDTEYLCCFIDTFLLSEKSNFKEGDLDEEISKFEKLYNQYAVRFGVHYFDRFNPHEMEFTHQAKVLFKQRVRLEFKKP
jgi:hypothetical protein